MVLIIFTGTRNLVSICEDNFFKNEKFLINRITHIVFSRMNFLSMMKKGGVCHGSPFVGSSPFRRNGTATARSQDHGSPLLWKRGASCLSLAPYPHYTVYVRMNSLPALGHILASALPVARTLRWFDIFSKPRFSPFFFLPQ